MEADTLKWALAVAISLAAVVLVLTAALCVYLMRALARWASKKGK